MSATPDQPEQTTAAAPTHAAEPAPRPPRRRLRRYALRAAVGLGAVWLAVTGCAVVVDATLPAGGLTPQQAAPGGHFVNAGGVLTHYDSWGDHGSPIVMVGGFIEPSSVWERVAPQLARNHRVYALDVAGFGYSARTGGFTLADWADQVQAFDRALGIRHPLLVGHSLGAAVVAEVARRDPSAVRGIVMADGDGLKGGGGASWVRQLLVDPYRAAVIRLALNWDWAVKQLIARAWGPSHPPIGATEVARWTRPFEVEGSEAALGRMAANGIVGLSLAQLGTVRTPAAVIFGADDSSVPVANAREIATLLHAQLTLLPQAGHLSMLADPGRFAAAVLRFDASLGR